MWGALSNERTGLPFTIAADPRNKFMEAQSTPYVASTRMA
jgi:hypothetical protein